MTKPSFLSSQLFRSFRTRLILVISGLFFIVAIAYYLYTISMQRSLFKESFSTTTRNLTESIKLGIEVGLSEENYQSISKVFTWAKKEKYVSFIILTDEELNILAQYPEEVDFSLLLRRDYNSSTTDDSVYIQSMVYTSQIVKGNLIVGCSTKTIDEYEEKTLADIGLSVAGVLILAIVLIALLTSGITRPLNNLKNVTDRIANGDEIIRANELKGGIEITSVSKAFNQMVDVLINTRTALEKDLTDATEFVKSILPDPIHTPLQIDWRFIPSQRLGGDSFGYHQLNNKTFAFFLVDVSGHGVGAALLSISVINMLRTRSLPNVNFTDPSSVLAYCNNTFLMEDFGDKYFTIWYGVLDLNTNILTYACGGHPPAILLRKHNEQIASHLLGTKNMFIGGLPDIKFSVQSFQLKPADEFFIFSDGIYELELNDDKVMNLEDFVIFLTKFGSQGTTNLDALIQKLKELQGKDHFEDDCSILRITIPATAS